MTLEDLTEDKIISETEKLLYIYRLKHTIRYGEVRPADDYTESVGEHIFGMNVLVDYFIQIEDPERKLKKQRVYELITWHESDEIELGDIPSSFKTDQDKAEAKESLPKVLKKNA